METPEISSAGYNEAGLCEATVKTMTDLLKIFSFSTFFDTVAASLARLLDADGAALIIYDGPDRLRYKLFYGLETINQESIVKFSFSARHGTAGHVLTTGQHLFTQDYPRSGNAMPEFIAAGLRSNLVLPLPGPNGFIGAVTIAWIHREASALTRTNLAIAEMFAALVGSAVYREELQRKLEGLSLTDPLTRLPNRRMLMIRLTEAQKRACRNQTLMVLAVADLDGFKAINDQLGHATGDQKLVAAAAAIRTAIRDIDMLARFGGDEFVVVLEDLKSPNEIGAILDRIVKAVEDQVNDDPGHQRVTVSLGATIYPIDFTEPEVLLKHADEAMYIAKRSGGNRVYVTIHNPATKNV